MALELFSRLRLRNVVDRRDAVVVGSRLVSLVVGPLTTIAIGLLFTAEMQGIYYSFASIIAALVFFESGVGTVIVQLASRESSKINFNDSKFKESNASRLAAVLRFAIRWYWGLAGLGAGTIFTVGVLLFGGRSLSAEWRGPWLALCLVSALGFMQQPFFSFLEGAGQLISVYKYRLIRSLLQSMSLLLGVAGGLGLWALALSVSIGVAVGGVYLLGYRGRFLALLRCSSGSTLNWRSEVLPFQGRVAISWISGYFGVSFLTPILLTTQGPVAAGRFGMTVALFNACTQLAAGFIQSQAPTFGKFAAQGRWQDLDHLFRRKATLSISAAFFLIAGVSVIFSLLHLMGATIANRVVHPWTLLLLGLGFMAYHIEGVMAFFMRAQLKEPYYILELTAALVSVPAAIYLSRIFGIWGAAGSFSGVHIAFILPVAFFIFKKNRRLVL